MGGRGSGSGIGAAKSSVAGSFHEFPDRHKGGWEYEGDGRDAVKFFKKNSNFDELISGMDHETRNAFRSWSSGWFMSGEQWGGWDSMPREARRLTKLYDGVLDRSEISEGFTVTRLSTPELLFGKGHRDRPRLEDIQAMKGKDINVVGNMSTGAAQEGLALCSTTRGNPIEYYIKIPAGSKVAGMWIGDRRINGWEHKQREFMTNRDIVLTVGNATYDSRRKKFVVELIYKGRNEHDYGRSGK